VVVVLGVADADADVEFDVDIDAEAGIMGGWLLSRSLDRGGLYS